MGWGRELIGPKGAWALFARLWASSPSWVGRCCVGAVAFWGGRIRRVSVLPQRGGGAEGLGNVGGGIDPAGSRGGAVARRRGRGSLLMADGGWGSEGFRTEGTGATELRGTRSEIPRGPTEDTESAEGREGAVVDGAWQRGERGHSCPPLGVFALYG